MKKKNFSEVLLEPVNIPGAKNTGIRWLIAEKDGAPNFALRMFELEKDGCTPYHSHAWEHEVFAVEGTGAVVGESGEIPLNPGDAVLVPPNEEHNFTNKGDKVFKFLCIIPIEKK
ncbi:MAG TPA: cupin domain-containing protein [Firmicutes bacterium]|nr:cupin domain-containing protein [Bacillota bacterium]